jgi:flagellar hook assembly protein FlgD
MTPNGRVVKELTNNDLGDLQIGTRVTERSWDGTDNFGDKLANGVYFYRVRALDNAGQKIDLMSNETLDVGFKNGFGKLVILR